MTTFKEAMTILGNLGIKLGRRNQYGEYTVRESNGELYFTDDLDDAVATGRMIADREPSWNK